MMQDTRTLQKLLFANVPKHVFSLRREHFTNTNLKQPNRAWLKQEHKGQSTEKHWKTSITTPQINDQSNNRREVGGGIPLTQPNLNKRHLNQHWKNNITEATDQYNQEPTNKGGQASTWTTVSTCRHILEQLLSCKLEKEHRFMYTQIHKHRS